MNVVDRARRSAGRARASPPSSISRRTSNAVSSALETSTTSRPITSDDRAGQVRVVGAAQQQRVDARPRDRREQALGEDVHLVGVELAPLDELDEARGTPAHGARASGATAATAAWYAPEAMVPTVPITPTCPLRVACAERPHARLDHADDRHVEAVRSDVERGRRAVLHATTTSFTPRRSTSSSVICVGEAAHLVAARAGRRDSDRCRRGRRGPRRAAGR